VAEIVCYFEEKEAMKEDVAGWKAETFLVKKEKSNTRNPSKRKVRNLSGWVSLSSKED